MSGSAVPAIPAPDPEGLWDRRRRLVAAEMEAVALGMFAEQGYENVTTEDIARACGMSVRTFFRYFNAKRDVLLAFPRRSLALLCDAVLARPPDEDLLTSWRRAAVDAAQLDQTDLELIPRVHAILLANPGLREMINSDAELTARFVHTNAQRLGVATDDDLRPAIVGGAVRTALIAAMEQWAAGRSKDLASSFDVAFDILVGLDTIRPTRGRRTTSPRRGS